MNKQRRAALAKIEQRLVDLQELLATDPAANVDADLDSIETDLENLRDEEQEYFDEMPEGLQMGSRGDAATEAIENLESALEAIKNDDLDEAIVYIQDAAS